MNRNINVDQLNLDGGNEMNKQKVGLWIVVRFAFVLLGALMIAGCSPRLRVGELQSESQSVELGDANSVRVEINFGAGNLKVTGGAEELLEADFTYNVAKLKPEVEFTDGTLVVRQPESGGMPALQGITDFRNEWNLRLNSEVPMDLNMDVGAGISNLQLGDLSLTGLGVNLGASKSTVDLSGDWVRDLKATIDAGATDITVVLPKEVGVRVTVASGPHTVEATGLTQDGDVYTNAAYGVSEVTLDIQMEVGIGLVKLVVE
jgi:hypothetical protein